MQVDTEHIHHWMQAIRQSEDPLRTMDAFWSGQLKSKEWLITNLEKYVKNTVTIEIHGGWVGVLASLLFQSRIPISYITSIDIDEKCNNIATTMNKLEEINGKFKAITSDMCQYSSTSDVIINTSCEHITQNQYDMWLNNIKNSSLIVLQSNNYNISEHIRISHSLDEFTRQSHIDVIFSDELQLPLYTRYMLIGFKLNV